MIKIAFEEHFGTPELMGLRKEMLTKRGMFINLPPEELKRTANLACDIEQFRIPSMEKSGIKLQVLQGGSNGIEGIENPQTALEKAKAFNDTIADVVARYPDKFLGLAILPLQDPELAAREYERCTTELGLRGIASPGFRINDGLFLDDKIFEPVFKVLEDYHGLFYLHPTETPIEQTELYYKNCSVLNGPTWSWGVDTATSLMRLIFNGVFDRFPGTRVLVGHMGEMIPYSLWRMNNRWKIMSAESCNQKQPSDYFKENIYITTSGNLSPAAMKCAIEAIGSDRILFGVDYPFEPIEEAAEYIDTVDIEQEDRENICYKNAEKLLNMKFDVI